MLCDDSIVAQLAAGGEFDFKTDPLLICKHTTISERGRQKSKKVFVCTETRIGIFSKKTLRKRMQVERKENLWNIRSVDLVPAVFEKKKKKKESELQIVFSDDFAMEIIDERVNFMAQKLAAQFRRVFLDSDMPNGNWQGIRSDSGALDPNSFCKCVRFQIDAHGRALVDDFLPSIHQIAQNSAISAIIGCEYTIDLNNIEAARDYQEILFYALAKYQPASKLIVPDWSAGGTGMWGVLSKFIKLNNTLKTLVTCERLTDDFDDFIMSAKNNPGVVLETLEFAGVSYDRKAIGKVTKLVQSCPTIKTLSFTGGLGQAATDAVVDELPMMESLERLELAGIPQLNLDALMMNLPRIEALKLTYCDFELCDLFLIIVRFSLSLKEINASGNRASRTLPRKSKLSSTLTKFVMREIEWKNNNLIALMELISDRDAAGIGVSVDISRATMTEDAWQEFDEFIATHDDRVISEFIYGENRMSKSVIEFFKHCHFLASLHLCGCFCASDELVSDFCRYIRQEARLVELHLTGSETKQLGGAVKKVLHAAKSNKSIRLLDIRDQHIGSELLLPSLIEFLNANQTVCEIFFDGNNLLNTHELDKFAGEMRERGTRLTVHMPERDIMALAQLNSITLERIRDISADIMSLDELPEPVPVSAMSTRGPYRTTGESTDSLSDVGILFLEDHQWRAGLNFAPLGTEKFHYDNLDRSHGLEKLIAKLLKSPQSNAC